MENITQQTTQKFNDAVAHFTEAAKKLRTGRAHPSMLEKVIVEVYGQPTPLQHAATISAVDPQLLQISPFDPGNISAITNAIASDQSLGLNPSDDGRIIRVPIPPLTEERRMQIVKQLSEEVEKCNITFRSIRHDALKAIDQAEKDKEISQDDQKRFKSSIEDALAKAKTSLDQSAKEKEAEIMKV